MDPRPNQHQLFVTAMRKQTHCIQFSPSCQGKSGDPYRIRTDVNGVRGRCLNHLTNGPYLLSFLRAAPSKPNNVTHLAIQAACINRRSSPRAISTGQLHTLLHFHLRPIYQVVFLGPYSLKDERSNLRGSFTLRCFQRLSRPYIATQLCPWQDNWCTRGTSIPVLSY